MIGLIVTLVVVAVALYLIELIPMDATLKQIIRVVVILLVVLWLLNSFGLFAGGGFGSWGHSPRPCR